MKKLSVIGFFLLIGIASNTWAVSCSDDGYSKLNKPNAVSALSNKRIWAVAPGVGGEEWNEDHCAGSGGALYKVGDGSVVDPRTFRGTWAVGNGNPAPVTYSYTVGGSSTYTWKLWGKTDGRLCWEDAGTIIATAPAPAPVSAGTPCSVP